jgi:ABC-type branched-subunit amino acid transport system substrate-binding protein
MAIGIAKLEAATPIIIGVSNVQSGPSRSLGQELTRGSQAYFDLVNSTGGIRGRRISMIVLDDHYEPEPAVQNTNILITRAKAFFLFDYVGTPTLTRVLPLLRFHQEDDIVNVAPFTGAEPQRTAPYASSVFNIRASYREEAHAIVDYLFAKGYRRIGFLGQADSYGKSGQVGVEEALGKHGLRIIASVAYRRNDQGANTMTEQVSFLRSKGVDAVIAVAVYGPCSVFVQEARLSGWQVPIANVSFVNAEALLGLLRAQSRRTHVDLTRNLINSQVVPFPSDRTIPLVRGYLDHLYDEAPGFTSLEGWLNAVVVGEAIKRAGMNPSRKAFVTAMESLHGWDPGIGCRLRFASTEHQGLHKVWLTKTKNQAWVPENSPDEVP